MREFEAMDFFRDETLVADPYPYLDALRRKCPVQRERHHDVVMVTGYEEAVEVFHDSEAFSSCISVTGPFPGFPVPLDGDGVSALIERHRHELPMNDQLPTMDPPTHTDHRALLMRLITPKRLKENEALMWDLADRMLDPFLTPGEGEFISGFAGPFTLLVIADLLGVPEEDQDEFLDKLQRQPAQTGGVGGTGAETLAHSPLEFLYGRFTGYIEDRRRSPRADVLTGLAGATFPDGSTPEIIDVVRVAANLFSAGQETTVRLLGSALKILAEQPDLQRQLRAERERIPAFIEETLRWESPVKGDFRLSRVPVTVGGVQLPAGTTVMVVNGAANRDPRRFENPETFDVARSNARQHLAFGRGIHSCPGAPLARAEARASLERLLDRTTDIRVNERVHGPAGNRRYEYMPTFILRGLTALHLEFDLAPAPPRDCPPAGSPTGWIKG
ncbi:cytochrome P450 [Parafrankia sp. FMc6]|uniref:cytochrome P450 n=1 Tax=Parafrankia soli TaxID=2599596 RepID=UPI0034D64B15